MVGVGVYLIQTVIPKLNTQFEFLVAVGVRLTPATANIDMSPSLKWINGKILRTNTKSLPNLRSHRLIVGISLISLAPIDKRCVLR